MAITLILVSTAIAIFILSLIRSSLGALPFASLGHLAEGKGLLNRVLKIYSEQRISMLLTLHLSFFLSISIFGLCFFQKRTHLDISGLLILLGLGFILVGIPQAIALINPEKTLLISLPFLFLFLIPIGILTLPIGMLYQNTLKMLKSNEEEEDKEEEIQALIDAGESQGILEAEDSELIQSVVEFGDTVVKEVTTPRTEMVCADGKQSVNDIVILLSSTSHTRIPIYDNLLDNIIGVVHIKDVFSALAEGRGDTKLRDIARPLPFVPENKPIPDLLHEFQSERQQIAIVVDEYGGVDGIVTTEDLLEEIVGELEDSFDTEREIIQQNNAVVALGRASVDSLSEALNIEIPAGDYTSVGGWISTELGRIPRSGETCNIGELFIKVLSADKRRIHRIEIQKLPSDN